MLTFPTRNLFIEGPDCSGKTTLIGQIHDDTGYRWHIHDRSQLSRKIFCDFYGRKINNIDYDLHVERSNLNNRYFILMPSFNVVNKRFNERGDEIHTAFSLYSTYKQFQKASEKSRLFPNTTVLHMNEDAQSISSRVISILDLMERPILREVSDTVCQFVENSRDESYPLEFTLYDDGEFEEASESSMLHPSEAEYYKKIYDGLLSKIDDEIDGNNEYSRKESVESRRFVYSDSSCISFIQVSIRNNVMDFHVVIRSSNVKDTLPHDVNFLYFLASTCYNRFKYCCSKVRMRFNLNSAHIIS
jgi:hypothetical protein